MSIDYPSWAISWRRLFRVMTLICLCFLVNCSDRQQDAPRDPVGPETDLGPTAVVADLKITAITPDMITISWTAPATGGEDLICRIRHSEDSITDANWNSAVLCMDFPSLEDSGKVQSYDLTGLPAGKLSYIAVRTRNGAGRFGPTSENVTATLPSLLTEPAIFDYEGDGMAASDLDSDGDIDLIIARPGSSVLTLMNNGTGRFSPKLWHYLSDITDVVRTADFNNDGFNDVAVLSTRSFHVFTNDGTGSLTLAHSQEIGLNTHAMQVGDIDGDGFTDIIASSWLYWGKFGGSSGLFAIYFNDGSGGFNGEDTLAESAPTSICVADIDGDGDQDIATTDANSAIVTIRYNDGTGRGWDNRQTVDMGVSLNCVTLEDMNNDGKLDLLGASVGYRMVAALQNSQEGSFSLNISTPYAGGGTEVGLGDFDGDGFLDVARLSSALTLHLNDGRGGFAGAAEYYVGGGSALEIADFDGDNHPDVAVLDTGEKLLIFLSSL